MYLVNVYGELVNPLTDCKEALDIFPGLLTNESTFAISFPFVYPFELEYSKRGLMDILKNKFSFAMSLLSIVDATDDFLSELYVKANVDKSIDFVIVTNACIYDILAQLDALSDKPILDNFLNKDKIEDKFSYFSTLSVQFVNPPLATNSEYTKFLGVDEYLKFKEKVVENYERLEKNLKKVVSYKNIDSLTIMKALTKIKEALTIVGRLKLEPESKEEIKVCL